VFLIITNNKLNLTFNKFGDEMKKGEKKYNVLFFLVFPFIFSGLLIALTIKDASIEELTLESDLVVKGTVKSIECKWENEKLKKINTIIQLEITEYYKGNGNRDVEIVQMGGKINDIEDIIIGTPRLNLNEEVLVFLVKNNNQYEIHSIALGCYKLRTNDRLQKIAINKLNDIHLISKDSNKFVSKEKVKKEFLLSNLRNQIESIVNQ